MKKKGWTALFKRKQYLIAGTLVVIAAIGTTMLYSSNQEKERAQMEAELAEEVNQKYEEVAVAEETETEESAEASAVIPPETTEETESTETADIAKEDDTGEKQQTDEAAAGVEPLHFSPEDELIWPMEGNVIMNYSMDATVYYATLDQYKYNPAVIIAGDVNSKVYSAARGQIQSIENSEETGCTVTVNLGDGYQAVYGQLKELNFEVGDYVESGHVIGYISEPTKYFSVEGSNLYFELLKDGEPVDPVTYFQ